MRAWLWVWLTHMLPTKAQRFDAQLARAYKKATHHERYKPW